MKISNKKVTSKNKGKKKLKNQRKNYKKEKKNLLKFICHWFLISKIPLKFVMIFLSLLISGDIFILRQNKEYSKNNDCQLHFLKFLFSGKKEDIGKFHRIFWHEKKNAKSAVNMKSSKKVKDIWFIISFNQLLQCCYIYYLGL